MENKFFASLRDAKKAVRGYKSSQKLSFAALSQSYLQITMFIRNNYFASFDSQNKRKSTSL